MGSRPDRWNSLLAWTIEGVLLLLICLSPWAFGAVHLYFELWLTVGLATLLGLWALRILILGQFAWQSCPVALCLAALFLLAVAQLVPLSPPLHRLLSPESLALRDSLFPVRPEILPDGVDWLPTSNAARSTVSVDPGATRFGALRLLAVFLAFAVVRNTCAFPGALRRLAMATAINGALLSLVGILQFLGSRPNDIYGTFPSKGLAFGPFHCRNHFVFYVNLCLGLATGLLLSICGEREATVGREDERTRGWRLMVQRFQDPKLLWLSVALAMMLGAVVLSLSRGGILSLIIGGFVCLLVGARGLRLSFLLSAISFIVIVALGIVWFGLGRVEARLATLGADDISISARLSMWQRMLPVAGQHPWLGTGLGTFGVVEPLNRPPREDPSALWDHAHNDYVEALIEGGLARLCVSLLAIGLVFRLGIRSYRNCQGRPEAGLVLGALMGFTAIVVHSAVDFGLHVPAVALLAAVVAAFLCMSSEGGLQGSNERCPSKANSLRLGRLAAVVAAGALVFLGMLMVHEVRREEKADNLRLRAARIDVSPGAAGYERRLELLRGAVAWTPENATLQTELAEAYFASYKDWRATLERARAGLEAAQLVSNLAAEPLVPASAASAGIRARTAAQLGIDGAEQEAKRSLLVPALVHYVSARAACPLLALPHMRLAATRDALLDGDPCREYLARAKRLRPADTEIWYISGLEELQRGEQAEAWQSWRQALRCSRLHLSDIVARSTTWLSAEQLIAHVLPEDAEELADAAVQLFPNPSETLQRRPFVDAAMALLESPRDAAQWRVKGRLYQLAGQPSDALAAYRIALSREPRRTDWRLEYAELLYRESRFSQAREELVIILDQQPNHGGARALLSSVTRKLPILP
ncbi:MAG: O-antigen ligase family protein [Gemmataceae bacterium]|nr:O-antigen ligase family protein [Gemmataceae bacterium]